MITPVGKRKDQVHQGPLKHQSILNDDSLFTKEALQGMGDMDLDMPEKKTPEVPGDIQQTMNDSQSPLNSNPDVVPGVDSGTPQTEQAEPLGQSGGWQQGMEQVYGPRVARILSDFLGQVQEAGMMSSSFMPDPKKTQFVISGGGLKLEVPNLEPQAVQQKVAPAGQPALGQPMPGQGRQT
jgi:hypothetical protein